MEKPGKTWKSMEKPGKTKGFDLHFGEIYGKPSKRLDVF